MRVDRPRPRRARWVQAGALAAVLVAAGLGAVRPDRGGSAPPPAGAPSALAATFAATPPKPAATLTGKVPDPVTDTLIRDDQLQLISRVPDATVATAQARLDQAAGKLAADQSVLTQDRSVAGNAARVRKAATAAVRIATSARAGAVAAHDGALAAVAVDQARLQALAVGWYTGGASVNAAPPEPLAAAQAARDANTELGLLTGLTSTVLRHDTRRAQVTGAAVTVASTTLAHARATLANDVRDADHAAAVLSAAGGLVTADRSRLAAVTVSFEAAQTARAKVIAAFDKSEGGGPDPVPSILGPTAMTASDMAAWFVASGRVAATAATIEQLASFYMSEGRAEGVRGDIAFAQAVVETGAFDSPDAVGINNYAGVGHCDSCHQGLRFPSPLAGVRGQIQLLRTYADATLTSADLPSPPAIAVLAPQAQGARGCCRTWNALTGVWATDPHYGTTILGVYMEMLTFAVTLPPPSPVAG